MTARKPVSILGLLLMLKKTRGVTMTSQPATPDSVHIVPVDATHVNIVVDGRSIVADARLIAAAPRMLEALKSLRSLSAFKAEANGAGTVYCWCDHEQPDDPNADHAPLCITFRALLREIHGDPS